MINRIFKSTEIRLFHEWQWWHVKLCHCLSTGGALSLPPPPVSLRRAAPTPCHSLATRPLGSHSTRTLSRSPLPLLATVGPCPHCRSASVRYLSCHPCCHLRLSVPGFVHRCHQSLRVELHFLPLVPLPPDSTRRSLLPLPPACHFCHSPQRWSAPSLPHSPLPVIPSLPVTTSLRYPSFLLGSSSSLRCPPSLNCLFSRRSSRSSSLRSPSSFLSGTVPTHFAPVSLCRAASASHFLCSFSVLISSRGSSIVHPLSLLC
jgi:hypothetical protein